VGEETEEEVSGEKAVRKCWSAAVRE